MTGSTPFLTLATRGHTKFCSEHICTNIPSGSLLQKLSR